MNSRILLLATPLALWTGCEGDKSPGTTKCVAAGTLVATPRGWVAIEALQLGDPIFAIDLERGALVATEVVELRRARRECLALVADDGRELVVTPDHPVHVPEVGGYVEAGRVALRQAASLTLVDGALPEAQVRRHEVGVHRLDAGVHDVFDIGVASEHHNFVAGGFVVHNKSTTAPTTTTTDSGTTTDDGPDSDSESDTGTGEPTSTSSGTTDDTATGDPATFPCGEQAACLVAAEYCEIFHPGQPEGMITHTCMPLPAACIDMADCTCLEEQGVFGTCMPGPEGGLTVSIFAP